MKKQSIRNQFACTTILIIAVTILICILANAFFLDDIYTADKKKNLAEAYQLLQGNAGKEEFASEEFIISLDKTCSKYNLNTLILDERNYPVLYSAMDLEALSTKLVRYRLGYIPVRETLEETNSYVIQTTIDTRTNTEKMEMWGVLENGYTFIFSAPLESITESAMISGKFMCIIGLAAVLLGGVIAWIYSGKISNPILKLAELSDKITSLDFEAQYNGKERNEIGILGNNMNSLSASLKQTISELKTANIELQQDIRRKEEVDLQRREFIANVSHELKTPIALIQGYAEGLQENISDDPESRSYYLEVISDEAERMNRMVKNLMMLSELENGQKHLTIERFDLAALVRNYITNADILLKEQDVKLELNIPQELYAWGDEFKVEEVVMNYFSNAVHYVAGEHKRICVSVEQSGEKAIVSVFNSGVSIPAEDLEHIWEKFYKVDKARTRAYGGSGVGLSIVKAIMNGLQQEYGVENVDGGVKFWFELSTV